MLNSPEYNQQREHIMKLQKSLVDSGQIPTCTNCDYFGDEICLKFNIKPPSGVIVIGCVYHMPSIPF